MRDSQLHTWNEHDGATIVCHDGHVMLRKIPVEQRPVIDSLIKEMVDHPEAPAVFLCKHVGEFLVSHGLQKLEGFIHEHFYGPAAPKPKAEDKKPEASGDTPPPPKPKAAKPRSKPSGKK